MSTNRERLFPMPTRAAAIALFAAIVASVARPGVAADWADPAKALRIAFPIDVSGLDPAGTQETYATVVEGRIFDALYQWDYLARPYRFVPSVATGMPEISADGRVWTIRIRSGIYFADDPAFAGKKRELTAADFVYAWKRIVDPRVRSPNSDLLEHKIVGSTPRSPRRSRPAVSTTTPKYKACARPTATRSSWS
jgi:oligopeptide transport system substrate-binding protein